MAGKHIQLYLVILPIPSFWKLKYCAVQYCLIILKRKEVKEIELVARDSVAFIARNYYGIGSI